MNHASKWRTSSTVVLTSLLVVSLFTGEAPAQDPREAVERCKSATALVDLGVTGSGTAFCVHESGLFVTNLHVVASVLEEDAVKLVLNPGGDMERVVEGRVVSIDAENDLALIRTAKVDGIPALPLGKPDSLFETMSVTTYGYPFGQLLSLADDTYPSISITLDRVSALRRIEGKLRALQIDGAINPGHSGGPIVDDDGNVVGVAVATIPGANVGFAIPVGVLHEFLDKPGLVMDVPDVRFLDRGKPLDLNIEVVPFHEESRPDAIRLELYESPQARRTVDAERKGDVYHVSISPVAEVPSPAPLLLAVRRGDRTTYHRVTDAAVSIGSRTLRLLDVRNIQSRPELHILATTDKEKLAGEFAGWDRIRSEDGPITELQTADRIDVFAIGNALPQVLWRIVALREGKEVAAMNGSIDLQGFPVHVSTDVVSKFLESLADHEKQLPQIERQLEKIKQTLPDSIAQIAASRSMSPQWITPEPTLIRSEGQATFTRQDDGSYFVEGNNPPKDTYELRYRLPFPIEKLTAIRLEVLQDDRLPKKGVGRGKDANIVLNEVNVSAVPPGQENGIEFDVLRATADFEQLHWKSTAIEWPIDGAVDGDLKTGWALQGQQFEPHVAVFEVDADVDSQSDDEAELFLRLRQEYGKRHTIGRLRLSVTDSPRPVLADRLPENVEAILAQASDERTDEQRRTLHDYFVRTDIRLRHLEKQLATLRFNRPVLPIAALAPMDDPSLLPPEELTIEVAVDGDSDLYVFRSGLVWDHLAWKKPGRENRHGKYLLVNGEEWYPQWQSNSAAVEGPDQSDPYLLPLGPPIWDVEVVSITDLDGHPNPGRGSVKPEYENGRLKLSFRDPGNDFGLYRVRLRRQNVDR